MPQTVLIVDDHAGFRHAARALLEAEGFDVVGESATGGEGLEAVGRLRPDLVLLDVGLPDLDGIEVAGRLTACPGGGPAVVLTSSRDASDYPPHFEHAARAASSPRPSFPAPPWPPSRPDSLLSPHLAEVSVSGWTSR